ncbi:hypothetical protein [Sphingosinicella sp.]|uniref:hypothetical protein n=1 Tax=Sphingosinicella sp. TaxID=1917971 RepID=UPI0040381A24
MAFSYSAAWRETTQLIGREGHLLAPVAGVFLFLPSALLGVMFPAPEPRDVNLFWPEMARYYAEIWPWLSLAALVGMIGTIAILRLVLVPGTSVGAALVSGAIVLPFYLLLTLATGLIIGAGLLLLIVPGLYLTARLAPAAAVLVGEDRRNPAEAIGRAFALTKGHGWAVLGYILIVGFTALLAFGVAGSVIGSALIIAAGRETGVVLGAIAGAAFDTGFGLLLLLVYVSVYRLLAPSPSLSTTFD